jgi:single-strand DNA-binding protein
MNVFTFSGNLGNDCRTGNAGGQSVVNFSVACKSGYGQNEQTNWVDCALWGKRGESLQQYLVKGQQVVVSGELGTREHNGKTYITCKVNEVSLVGGKRDGQQAAPAPQQRQQSAPQQRQTQAQQAEPIDYTDDIPF